MRGSYFDSLFRGMGVYILLSIIAWRKKSMLSFMLSDDAPHSDQTNCSVGTASLLYEFDPNLYTNGI